MSRLIPLAWCSSDSSSTLAFSSLRNSFNCATRVLMWSDRTIHLTPTLLNAVSISSNSSFHCAKTMILSLVSSNITFALLNTALILDPKFVKPLLHRSSSPSPLLHSPAFSSPFPSICFPFPSPSTSTTPLCNSAATPIVNAQHSRRDTFHRHIGHVAVFLILNTPITHGVQNEWKHGKIVTCIPCSSSIHTAHSTSGSLSVLSTLSRNSSSFPCFIISLSTSFSSAINPNSVAPLLNTSPSPPPPPSAAISLILRRNSSTNLRRLATSAILSSTSFLASQFASVGIGSLLLALSLSSFSIYSSSSFSFNPFGLFLLFLSCLLYSSLSLALIFPSTRISSAMSGFALSHSWCRSL